MKRTLTILTTILLAGALLFACGIIPNTTTSFVTIRFGDDPQKAMLKAEAATPWARAQHFLAGVKLMPEAHAYIPSVVQVIIVTVTAADMTMPIVGVAGVKNTDTAASIRIEVPNGSARQFLVEGYRGVDSKVYYSGTASADLNGMDVTLDISMAFVGPGILVDNQHPSAADTIACGTASSPCLTITYALTSRTSGTDAILVSAGSYSTFIGAGPTETFPLQLQPGTALICTGLNHSTVIDQSQSPGMVTFYGNEAASIDNCQIIPSADGRAIDDQIGGVTPSRMKINGVLVPSPGVNQGAWESIYLTADSLVVESTIQASNNFGIEVASGKPAIMNTTLSGNPTGVEITGGDPVISDSLFTANTTGINIASPGKPSITTSTFDANGTGLSISAGNADVSTSTFINNSTGIDIIGGSPRIRNNTIHDNTSIGIAVATSTGSDPIIQSNEIYCSYFGPNLSSSTTTTLNVQGNSWENSPPIVALQQLGCLQGTDICYAGPEPDYSNAGPAAPGICTRPLAKPVN